MREPGPGQEYAYDVFISYSHRDETWVRDWLLPRLEGAGLRVCIDFRDFDVGVPSLVNMERAVGRSRRTLLVLTPDWAASEWTQFEALMLQTEDPIGTQRRMLPLMLKDCQLPPRLKIFTYADFRSKADREAQFQRLLGQVGETPAGPALRLAADPEHLKISLARLPSTPPDLFGREAELARLDAAWDEPGTHLISLVAWGGVGKTALVNTWLGRMGEDGWRGAERVYGWSFYSQGAAEGKQASADLFIASALEWFGDPDPTRGSAWDKGERLAGLVCGRPTLLVLDGLEPLQYPPGPQAGRLKDPGLQSLLRTLARHNPGLVVLTTRLAVDDLKDMAGTSARRLDLEHLSVKAGAAYLRHLGVTGADDELEAAAAEYEGHALALTLLGRYLAVVHQGDIRCRDRIARLVDERGQGAHARRVMAAYEEWFRGGPELAILLMMGLFDRPAEAGALAALRARPAIPGLTERLVELPAEEWGRLLVRLRRAGLLAAESAHRPDDLDAHPLVREHFADRLQAEAPGAWREAHGRLFEYYRAQAPETPDTLEEMASLYAAVAHGCQAGRHQEALAEVYWRRIKRRDEYFSTKKLGAFGADLAALAGFFDPPWRRAVPGLSKGWQGFVLGQAGLYLRALGRLREAREPMRAALEAAIALEDWKNAAIRASNLSELGVSLGELAEALEAARQSVDFATQSGDAFWRMACRTALADALLQAGRPDEAVSLFREAEAMQKERQPTYPLLYSVQGYQYCDLLLDQGAYAEVLRRAGQTINWEFGRLLDIALDHLALGRAHLMGAQAEGRGDFSAAAEQLDLAVDGLRAAGQQDYLPRGLLARAALRRAMGQLDRARADLEEAMRVATRGGMRRHEADAHLERARLALAGGDPAAAREHLAQAREIVRDTGYHRRDGEVAELAAQLDAH